MKEKKDFNFIAGDIGDALAFIVSQMERDEYVFEYVRYYAPYWRRGQGFGVEARTALSIVKRGYENLYFVNNQICPWMIAKISHPITCVQNPLLCVDADYYRKYDPYRKLEGNFETEFQDNPDNPLKVNPFPYLNEFINQLAIIQKDKKLNKKEILELAKTFVITNLKEDEKTYNYFKK